MKTAIMKRLLVSVATVFSFTLPVQAALFDGQTVQLTYEFPAVGTINDTRTFVVGAGVEALGFPTSDQRTNIDFSDTNIFVDYLSAGTWGNFAFNGFHVFDLSGTIPDFVSVSIDAATNMAGFNSSRITFDANNIFVNWQNLNFNADTIVSLNVTAVPEPEIYAMMGIGLALMGFVARRKKKRQENAAA